MLLLLFRLGDERCALDAACVAEVLPLVGIERTLGAPAGIVGTLSYRGRFVPTIDLSERLLGRPAAQRLSTRVVLVTIGGDAGRLLLGLVLENATSTIRCDPAALIPPAIGSQDHPWLGPIFVDADGPIRLIDVDRLLTDDIRQLVSPAPAEPA
jgi:chemotaxis-related protein WspB